MPRASNTSEALDIKLSLRKSCFVLLAHFHGNDALMLARGADYLDHIARRHLLALNFRGYSIEI